MSKFTLVYYLWKHGDKVFASFHCHLRANNLFQMCLPFQSCSLAADPLTDKSKEIAYGPYFNHWSALTNAKW